MPPIAALAAVKEAAALANRDVGQLAAAKAHATATAWQRIRNGDLNDQFVIDNTQGRAGTSTNMNATSPTWPWGPYTASPPPWTT